MILISIFLYEKKLCNFMEDIAMFFFFLLGMSLDLLQICLRYTNTHFRDRIFLFFVPYNNGLNGNYLINSHFI